MERDRQRERQTGGGSCSGGREPEKYTECESRTTDGRRMTDI